MSVKSYAIIGLGRFGASIAWRLYEAGQEVVGIDIDEEKVDDAKDYLTYGIVLDATDKEALSSVGINNFDAVIVGIGTDMLSSILTVVTLKEMGVKKVIAKAVRTRHGKVLKKIGADYIIYPERDMGDRVAKQLLSPNMLNYIELSKEYNIEEIQIPPKLAEKTLKELDIRAKYNLSVIALIHNGKIYLSPSPDQIIHEGDLLVAIGKKEDLARFSNIE